MGSGRKSIVSEKFACPSASLPTPYCPRPPLPLPPGRFCRSRLDPFLGNYIAARSHASVWRGSVAAVWVLLRGLAHAVHFHSSNGVGPPALVRQPICVGMLVATSRIRPFGGSRQRDSLPSTVATQRVLFALRLSGADRRRAGLLRPAQLRAADVSRPRLPRWADAQRASRTAFGERRHVHAGHDDTRFFTDAVGVAAENVRQQRAEH